MSRHRLALCSHAGAIWDVSPLVASQMFQAPLGVPGFQTSSRPGSPERGEAPPNALGRGPLAAPSSHSSPIWFISIDNELGTPLHAPCVGMLCSNAARTGRPVRCLMSVLNTSIAYWDGKGLPLSSGICDGFQSPTRSRLHHCLLVRFVPKRTSRWIADSTGRFAEEVPASDPVPVLPGSLAANAHYVCPET